MSEPFDYGGKRPDGQHERHPGLPADEIAKGFVRPLRQSYKHVGRAVCGKPAPGNKLGGMVTVCMDKPSHEGECWGISRPMVQPEAAAVERSQKLGGCGTVTRMPHHCAETYARQPSYYEIGRAHV